MNKIKKIVLSVLASGFAFVTAATCNGPTGFDFYRDDDADVYDVIVVDTVPVYVDTYPVYVIDDCYCCSWCD